MDRKVQKVTNEPQEERLVGAREGAAILGVAPYTLRKYAWQGRISRFKVGRKVLFRVSDLKELLERCRREADPDFELGR